MQKNIGNKDRIVRFVIAIFLFALAFWYGSWILGLAGAFVLFEALSSWCLFYQLIGKNTCPVKRD